MIKTKPLPKLDCLQQLFDYREDTGLFIRKTTKGNSAAGTPAGCKDKRGYCHICIDGTPYLTHRLVWFYMTGEDPAAQIIDHINGNPSDNRFCNLRICTQVGNKQNAAKSRNNKSGFKGVSFDAERGQWRASIMTNHSYKYLGRFSSAEQAHAAYVKAAIKLHGEFARTA